LRLQSVTSAAYIYARQKENIFIYISDSESNRESQAFTTCNNRKMNFAKLSCSAYVLVTLMLAFVAVDAVPKQYDATEK
jgi:hypothetical protein